MKGSIVQKANKFYIVVDLPRGNDGKRRQKWISNKDWKRKKDAEKALPRVLTELQDSDEINSGNLKFSDLLILWQKQSEISLRFNSLRAYQWAIRKINNSIGNYKLSQLKSIHISNFMIEQSGNGLNNSTLRLLYSVIRKALEQAVDWQMIKINPCDRVQRPSRKKYQAQVYGPEQIGELLKAAKDTPAYLIILLAIGTGMRRSEIAALRWKDINFKDKSLCVRNSISGGQLQPVKTQLSERIIVLPQNLIDELQSARLKSNSDFVISKSNGQPYNSAAFWYWLKKIKLENGLEPTRFQDLRHAHATHLIMSNVPVKTVSERLGHSSTAFTQDIYGHVLRPSQDKAAIIINELLENQLEKTEEGKLDNEA